MQALVFVMAIMGCGESDAACREVRIDQQIYQSEASCRGDMATALARHTDLEFPTIVARCRRADARPATMPAGQVLLPGPGRLPAAQAPRYASSWLFRSSR